MDVFPRISLILRGDIGLETSIYHAKTLPLQRFQFIKERVTQEIIDITHKLQNL